MGPSMLGMAVGGMVGQLAARAFGQYDLPIPRPVSNEIVVVPATIDAFAKAWSLAIDELRLWACLQEIATHAVLNVTHVRTALENLLRHHVAGFRPDPSALMDKLEGLEFGDADAATALQRTLGDPEVLLGAVQTPEQLAQLPRLDALVATIIGYVDHVVDRAASMLLGSHRQIGEAVRRRRVEHSPEDIFVERLLGLRLSRQQVERGRAFVDGVLERAGEDGLALLFAAAGNLPTPAEVDAPGLWLARLDVA
jgi:putative hydrolase